MPHGLRFDSSDSRLWGSSSVFNPCSGLGSESNNPAENGRGGITGLGVPLDCGRVCEFDLECGGGASETVPVDETRGSAGEAAGGVRPTDPLVANMVEYGACTGVFPPRVVPPLDLGVDGKRLTVSVLVLGVLKILLLLIALTLPDSVKAVASGTLLTLRTLRVLLRCMERCEGTWKTASSSEIQNRGTAPHSGTSIPSSVTR